MRHEGRVVVGARSTWRDECGATGVEYGLIVALVAVVVIMAVSVVGSGLANRFSAAAVGLSGSTSTADSSAGSATSKLMAAGDWLVAMGRATMAGTLLTLNGGGTDYQTRAFGNSPWGSSDMTITTTARQTGTANGYGLWLRTTRDAAGNIVSGYTFQVDPGAGGYVLRLWSNGAESPPLARVPVSGMDATQLRNLSVSMVGDQMVASVGGSPVMTVSSLSASVAAMNASSGHSYQVANGVGYGARAWGSNNTVYLQNTTIR
jgi:pilus assembly protein Flp/PilA